ncbi:hypothetical protein GH733_010697 [Mirounga leonina]|nr:hypothetical protein GH733_010697 [Mirounga leonina]
MLNKMAQSSFQLPPPDPSIPITHEFYLIAHGFLANDMMGVRDEPPAKLALLPLSDIQTFGPWSASLRAAAAQSGRHNLGGQVEVITEILDALVGHEGTACFPLAHGCYVLPVLNAHPRSEEVSDFHGHTPYRRGFPRNQKNHREYGFRVKQAKDTFQNVTILSTSETLHSIKPLDVCCMTKNLLAFYVDKVFKDHRELNPQILRKISSIANSFLYMQKALQQCQEQMQCHCRDEATNATRIIHDNYDQLEVQSAAIKSLGELDVFLAWIDKNHQGTSAA